MVKPFLDLLAANCTARRVGNPVSLIAGPALPPGWDGPGLWEGTNTVKPYRPLRCRRLLTGWFPARLASSSGVGACVALHDRMCHLPRVPSHATALTYPC